MIQLLPIIKELDIQTVLVLNGTLPGPHVLRELAQYLPIIACDGAFTTLQSMELLPQTVIGDWDSCPMAPRDIPTGVRVIEDRDQDTTDFQKALQHVGSSRSILVLGIGGGEVDHVLGNFEMFHRYSADRSLCFLHPVDGQRFQLGFVARKNERWSLQAAAGTKISFIAFEPSRIHSRGLKWELNDLELDFGRFSSLRNAFEADQVELQILQGNPLVVVTARDHRLPVVCREAIMKSVPTS